MPQAPCLGLRRAFTRGQHLHPKPGDQFIGDPAGGTILSGGIPLHRWIASGRYWVHADLPAPLLGKFVAGSDQMASSLNDLFVDDSPYHRVGELSQLTEGAWYFDPATSSAIITINPNGRIVEYSLTQSLVSASNNVTGVVIRDLTVEKYATDAQVAPIHGIRDWRVINVTSRHNHGVGLQYRHRHDCTGRPLQQ